MFEDDVKTWQRSGEGEGEEGTSSGLGFWCLETVEVGGSIGSGFIQDHEELQECAPNVILEDSPLGKG